MSKPRGLLELMTAVDAGLVVVDVDSAKYATGGRRRRAVLTGSKKSSVETTTPPAPASTDASFEFSTAVSFSSASPASMVFSDGQLRAHQFPASRSMSEDSSSKVATSPPVRSLRRGKSGSTTGGSKKRVSFQADGEGKTAAKARELERKGGGGGGLLGCMGSACRSSRKDVVEPAKNAKRKVEAV